MVRFPERTGDISLLRRIHTGSGAHKTSHPMDAGDSGPGNEPDHSRAPPEVKNGRAIPPFHHTSSQSGA
jgi:hypothetical protein